MNHALLTDLYELTMAASYHRHGMNGLATFDLFVRDLPKERNFLVAGGLEEALRFLQNFHFEPDDIDYVASLEMFDEDFLNFLADLRFTGEVWAPLEGEIMFAGEPLMSVTAPLIEAQIVETYLLNCITFQTMVASKAARVALACGDRTFVDFSARRDHGIDASLNAARATFIAGADATSNVLAGKLFGIPLSGTMAHSYVMAFEDELVAFRAFARQFPDTAVLLIDTFDTEEGARRAVKVAQQLAGEGVTIRGVRLDSGDIGSLAFAVRKIFDEAGFGHFQIVASGDMDEYRIKELLDDGAPVDAFGVGTQMGTSGDAPSLGTVYKLVADQGGPKMKLSTGKATLPGRKQVYRVSDGGRWDHDVIALPGESIPGRPLLERVMRNGQATRAHEPLTEIQARCRASLDELPDELRSLGNVPAYPVRISSALQRVVQEMERQGRYR